MSWFEDLLGIEPRYKPPTPLERKIVKEATPLPLREGEYMALEWFAEDLRDVPREEIRREAGVGRPEPILERKPLLPKDLLVHTQKAEDPARKTQEVVDKVLAWDAKLERDARGSGPRIRSGNTLNWALMVSAPMASAIPDEDAAFSVFQGHIYSTGRF